MTGSGIYAATVAVVCLIAGPAPRPLQASSAALEECERIGKRDTQPYRDNGTISSPDVCPTVIEFVKCLFAANGRSITENNLEELDILSKMYIEQMDWLKGVQCVLFLDVIGKLTDGKNFTTVTQQIYGDPSKDGELPNATDLYRSYDLCRWAFDEAIRNNSVSDICPYLKQLMRCDLMSRPGRYFWPFEIIRYQNMLEAEMAEFNASCKIDVWTPFMEHNSHLTDKNSASGPKLLQEGILASFGAISLLIILALQTCMK